MIQGTPLSLGNTYQTNMSVTGKLIQMMMNELYALTPTGGLCQPIMINEAKNNVILSQEGSYKDLMSNLPPRQKIVLQAIAKEGLAKNHHINEIHQEIQSQLCQFSSVCHQVIT